MHEYAVASFNVVDGVVKLDVDEGRLKACDEAEVKWHSLRVSMSHKGRHVAVASLAKAGASSQQKGLRSVLSLPRNGQVLRTEAIWSHITG